MPKSTLNTDNIRRISMHRFCHLFTASFFILIACNSARAPNEANFRRAINDFLAGHGEACTAIGRQFPIDLPRTEQGEQYGIGPKLAALEQAGLVHSQEITAVVHGMLDPLRGPGPAQPVKRYQLTGLGKKYFLQIPDALGQTSGFCYGQKSVDTIVKWTAPASVGTYAQTEVTYTYKISNIAGWAERPDIQQAFSDIRTTVDGASKTTEVGGLQLTSQGWEVPRQ
jgi:hypothetical protein